MMFNEALKALEFDKVLEIISLRCHSGISSSKTLSIRPLNDMEAVKKRFREVSDIRRLMAEGTPLRFQSYPDISPLLEKTRPEDSMLEPVELAAFIPVLEMLEEFSALLSGKPGVLDDLAGGIAGFPDILKRIERSVDSDGRILDTASSVLFEIRLRKKRLEAKIRKRLEDIAMDGNVAPFLQDVFVSQRSGRWVIPVRMDSKGRVQGVVHDVSRTGETAFMEPLEIIGLSNEFEALVAEEKTEEIRIIKQITATIRTEAPEINRRFAIIVELDAMNAVSEFADRLSMNIPDINSGGHLTLVGAKHPLLMLQRAEGRKDPVVPLDMRLDRESPVMVITGPNAGGKTIAIKTAGLLLLMAISGMPVPADSSSSFPLFEKLLADIGDEQSIESSLSTFSAHISNISSIVGEADSRSLVLMDELGTGTDPEEGAAISCAVLSDLMGKESLVLATTHLIDIVGFVHKSKGMTNASMQFDAENLNPLYRLITGEPGSSHALDIAKKYGLPQGILDAARGMLGSMKAELKNLILGLKDEREKYEKSAAEARKQTEELNSKNARLSERLSAIERERKEAVKKAYEEARDVIAAARREVRDIVEEAKRTKKAKDAFRKLSEAHIGLERKIKEAVPDAEPLYDLRQLKAGDTVYVKSLGSDAKIVDIDLRNERIKVQTAKISADVPLSSVGPPSTHVGASEKPPEINCGAVRRRETPQSLDVRGLRVDEALPLIERFLNDAVLDGLETVAVIHGIGTGALSKGIGEFLDGHPLVKRTRRGDRMEGGEGATVISLK